MILSGAPISADEASSMGLVSQMYEPGTVLENAIDLATQLAGNSPVAVGLAKEAIMKGEQVPRAGGWCCIVRLWDCGRGQMLNEYNDSG